MFENDVFPLDKNLQKFHELYRIIGIPISYHAFRWATYRPLLIMLVTVFKCQFPMRLPDRYIDIQQLLVFRRLSLTLNVVIFYL